VASSLLEGHEEGGTSQDPEVGALLAGLQVDVEHEGVPRHGSLPDRVVVGWALVGVEGWLRSLLDRLEVQHGEWHGQLHDIGFAQALLLMIPGSTFKIEFSDVSSVLWWLGDLVRLLVDWDEVELKSINRSTTSRVSGELLEDRGCETSRIREGSNPEGKWNALGSPFLEELIPFVQILEPVSERLQREVRMAPSSRHSVLLKSFQDFFTLC